MGASFQSKRIEVALESMAGSGLSGSLRIGCDICKRKVVRTIIYRQTGRFIGVIGAHRRLFLFDSYMHSMNTSARRTLPSEVLDLDDDEDSDAISDHAILWMTTDGAGPVWIQPAPCRPFRQIVMDWLTEPIPDVQVVHRIATNPRWMRLEKLPNSGSSLYVTPYSRVNECGYVPIHYGELKDVNRLELLFEPRRAIGAVPLTDIGRWLSTLSIHCGGRACLHDDLNLELEIARFGADYTALVTSFMGWTRLSMSEFAVVLALYQRAFLRYIRFPAPISSPLILSMLEAFGEGFYEELEHSLRERLKLKYGTDDYQTAFGNGFGWDRRRREVMAEWKSYGTRGSRRCK